MNKSESIAALTAALAIAQSKIENATKNSKNDHFKNRYADLAEVLNTARPVFADNGLSIMQFPSYAEGICHVETVLTHKSGEWVSGTASCRVTKDDAQGVGSAITYLRRYSLAAVAGIAQEDDDAEGAVGRPSNGQGVAKPVQAPKPAPAPSAKAVEDLFAALMDAAGSGGKDAFSKAWKAADKGVRHVISQDSERMQRLENACVDHELAQAEEQQ